MAKAIATCTCKTCGAKFEKITTKTNTREASRWEKWASEYFDECEECYKARIAQEHEAANAAAVEAANENGWPELTGTPKQIAWANTIRAAYIERLADNPEYDAEANAERAAIRNYAITNYTTAERWINIRNMDYYTLDRRIMKAMKAAQ